jgi:hypothetical protein
VTVGWRNAFVNEAMRNAKKEKENLRKQSMWPFIGFHYGIGHGTNQRST